MRLYFEVAKRGFRRFASYRGATIGGLFTNTVFGFMRCYILIALHRGRPEIGGYDLRDAMTYVWVTQAMIMIVYLWGWQEVSNRVRTGEIATDLSRPYDFQLWWLAQDYGRALYHAIARGIVPFVIGALVFDLRVPRSPQVWAGLVASLVIAVALSFAMRFMVNLGSFWFAEANGFVMIFGFCANLLSGFAIPVHYFPDWLQTFSNALPFVSCVQVPIDVFLGKHLGADLFRVLATGAVWSVALLAAGRALLAAGTRRLVVQGG